MPYLCNTEPLGVGDDAANFDQTPQLAIDIDGLKIRSRARTSPCSDKSVVNIDFKRPYPGVTLVQRWGMRAKGGEKVDPIFMYGTHVYCTVWSCLLGRRRKIGGRSFYSACSYDIRVEVLAYCAQAIATCGAVTPLLSSRYTLIVFSHVSESLRMLN